LDGIHRLRQQVWRRFAFKQCHPRPCLLRPRRPARSRGDLRGLKIFSHHFAPCSILKLGFTIEIANFSSQVKGDLIEALVRGRILLLGSQTHGTLYWTNAAGEQAAWVGYVADMMDPARSWLRLRFAHPIPRLVSNERSTRPYRSPRPNCIWVVKEGGSSMTATGWVGCICPSGAIDSDAGGLMDLSTRHNIEPRTTSWGAKAKAWPRPPATEQSAADC
jgi:hypothetical protein